MFEIFKYQNKRLRFHFLSIWILLYFWKCASNPPIPQPEPLPEPEPVVIIPDTVKIIPPSPPKEISIISVKYNINNMEIKWEKSIDPNFDEYRLLQSIGFKGTQDTIFSSKNINDMTLTLENFDPTKENYFWIDVKNITGLHTSGEKSTHDLEIKPPISSSLKTVEGKYDLKIQWSLNKDVDFDQYILMRSKTESMSNKEEIETFLVREDTTHILSLDSIYYYQIKTKDIWGLESLSNIIKGDYTISLWDKEYSMVETKKIDLSNQKLFGSIPSEIGRLLNLEILFLQNNFLSGSLPNQLWDLKNLRILNISKNQFRGNVPSEIHQVESLNEIWFSGNKFSGSLPFQIFTIKNITHINLSNNQLTGHISESVANLKNLVYLNLFDNKLVGSIPAELGECSKLEFLSLGRNNLSGTIPPEISKASQLESIALFENQLSGEIPIEILELKNLVYLGLFGNQFKGELSNEIFKNANLSYLRINNNKLQKVNYDSLCASGYNWDNSIYFDLSDNEFRDSIPECFSEPVFYEIYTSFKNKD